MMLYICTMFHKNVLNSFKLIERTISMIIIIKEHNYVKHICGVAFYVLCTSSDDALHGY